MGQSPLWEANSHSASQEIPCVLWNSCSQQPTTGPYPQPYASSSQLPNLFP